MNLEEVVEWFKSQNYEDLKILHYHLCNEMGYKKRTRIRRPPGRPRLRQRIELSDGDV